MLQGIETVFDNKEKMLGHLKKKSYEKNTAEFLERNGHYFQEMAEYVARAEDKEAAAREIGECLVKAVNDHFSNKKLSLIHISAVRSAAHINHNAADQ